MSSHEHDESLARIAADFIAAWDTGSPESIAGRLAEGLLVGDADHTTVVTADDLLVGMARRAAAVAGAAPGGSVTVPRAALAASEHRPLGPSRLLVTARWQLVLGPGHELPLVSDFLLDLTTTPPRCVAYLARQTLAVE